MNPKTIRVLVLVWLVLLIIGTALSLVQTGALSIFGYFLLAEAYWDKALFANGTAFILLIIFFLIIAGLLILPLVLAWKAWRKDDYKRVLTMSLIILGLILLPRLYFWI